MSMLKNDKVMQSLLDGLVDEVSGLEESLRTRYEALAAAATKTANEARQAEAATRAQLEAAREELAVMQHHQATLTAELGKANKDLKAAEQRIERETTARIDAEGALAEARRHHEAMMANDAHQASMDRLESHLTAIPGHVDQALEALAAKITSALAARPLPKVTPPTYEMRVTARDANNRPTNIRLSPAKE